MPTMTVTIELEGFAKRVAAAAARVPVARRWGTKVFISHVWAIGAFEMSLDEFKAVVLEAHRLGLLTLSRCDLVEAADPMDLRRSRTLLEGYEFHLIRAR